MLEYIDLDLNEEEDNIMDDIREYHWMYAAEEGDNKKKINYLILEV